MAQRTSQGLWMGVAPLPSGTAQPALPLAEALGRCNPDQRAPSPALAKEDVLYATRPKPPAQRIRATRSEAALPPRLRRRIADPPAAGRLRTRYGQRVGPTTLGTFSPRNRDPNEPTRPLDRQSLVQIRIRSTPGDALQQRGKLGYLRDPRSDFSE